MVRSNLFQGSANTRGATENPLPPRVEAYARALALRCVEMQGRPGSDVGVSYLLAQAFEANISVEQRSGVAFVGLIITSYRVTKCLRLLVRWYPTYRTHDKIRPPMFFSPARLVW